MHVSKIRNRAVRGARPSARSDRRIGIPAVIAIGCLLLGACASSSPAGSATAPADAGRRATAPNSVQHDAPAVAAPSPLTAIFAQGHQLGSPDAGIVIAEFTDFQCPYCRQYQLGVFPGIKRDFIDTGVARYVVMDFPLPMHPQAFGASVAADCAGAQGQYWAMHDKLFADQDHLGPLLYSTLAHDLGLDEAKFSECMKSADATRAVYRSLLAGRQLGISGTPTIMLARVRDGNIVVERVAVGVPSLEQFTQEIDKLRQ